MRKKNRELAVWSPKHSPFALLQIAHFDKSVSLCALWDKTHEGFWKCKLFKKAKMSSLLNYLRINIPRDPISLILQAPL